MKDLLECVFLQSESKKLHLLYRISNVYFHKHFNQLMSVLYLLCSVGDNI
jgi:hypothetical protein